MEGSRFKIELKIAENSAWMGLLAAEEEDGADDDGESDHRPN